MKKCVIFFFSGTGNTYMAARLIAQKLNLSGMDASLRAIDAADAADIEWEAKSADIVGIGYPVFNGVPAIVSRFLTLLPALKEEKECFIFTTMSRYCDDGAKKESAALAERGYNVTRHIRLLFACNAGMKYRVERDEEELKKLLSSAAAGVELLCDAIISGSELYDGGGGGRLFNASCGRLAKRMKKKLSCDAAKCDGCGECVRYCPIANISLAEKGVVFGQECCACMRCVNVCGREAVLYRGKPPKYGRYTGPYEEFRIADIYEKR